MKKLLSVLIAVLLIFIIAGVAIGTWYMDKYSYSKETVDLNEYYNVSGEQCAIVLQNDILEEEKALYRDNTCYMDLPSVHRYLNDGFYIDENEGLLLYTDAKGTYRCKLGESSFEGVDGTHNMEAPVYFKDGESFYVALDFVKQFTDFGYEYFGNRMQLDTKWEPYEQAEISKDTQIRLRGGVKSAVLRELSKGEKVKILEVLENWSKVKTDDAIIGYVENKRLDKNQNIEPEIVRAYEAPKYPDLKLGEKVCLGFHAIGGVGGNVTLDEMVSRTNGMNVIAPTWFSLNDNEGGYRNFGEASYVEKAHSYGLKVWGVWDNFNFENETGSNIDDVAILSSTTIRTRLVNSIVDTAIELGLDGVNLDFERLSSECGKHYAQFVKELSVACHQEDLMLSVDNYMPNEGNKYYRLDVQGKAADYVILMGYDEHWHGSKEPGSVASVDFVSNGITNTMKKVSADKIVNALPFYTIVWAVDGSEVTDEYLTMNNMADFLSQHSEQPVWDETTCQNYLEYVSGSKTFKVWLEDAESIRIKLNVMTTNNIGGVAVWRLGFGTTAAWDLISAYASFQQ